MQVIRRNGTVSKFDASKISVAMTKAFLAVEGHSAAASRRVHEIVEQLTAEVVGALSRRMSEGRTFHIEDVQDQVELALMRSEHHKVARAYVLYRDERTRQRAEQEAAKSAKPSAGPILHVTLANGTKVPLDTARLALIVDEACAGLDGVDAAPVVAEIKRNIYDGISQDELALASVMAARTLVEQEPNYAYVSARLLLDKLRTEVLSLRPWRADQRVAGRHGRAIRRIFSSLYQERHQGRTARSRSRPVRPEENRRRAQAGARPGVPVPGPANALRPLFPA